MWYRIPLALAAALAVCLAASPSRADGRWCVSFSASQDVATLDGLHGTGLDASAIAELHPLLGLGIETGTAYVRALQSPARYGILPASPGSQLASLTDGVTRNRGFYLGPVARIGRELALDVSAGLYELADGTGRVYDARWGESVGIALGGGGRHEPFAGLRARFVGSPSARTATLEFGVGLRLR